MLQLVLHLIFYLSIPKIKIKYLILISIYFSKLKISIIK